jgi:hypothetical protein
MAQTSKADYMERGPEYRQAWQVLARGCEIPPSIELFEQELQDQRRARPGLSVRKLAESLAERYQRVTFPEGFLDGDD